MIASQYIRASLTSRRTALSVLLFASVALAACSPVREYRRPDVALPSAYPGQEVSGRPIANVPYRSFFADPELRALIDSAVVSNHDLRIALRNIDYAKQSLNVARLGNLPAVNLQVTANSTEYSDNSLKAQSSTRDFSASLSASWEFDVWAKIGNRKKAALAEYLRSADAARAVRTRLVSDVAQGYWNLKMLDSQIDITRRNLTLADSTLTMMRLQYDAGNVTSLAVQQQDARLQAASQSIPRLEALRSAQENALSILAGRMPGSPVKRSPGLDRSAVPDTLGAGVPLELLRNRPDVRAAEESLMSQHASMGAAKAMLYPSLTVTAQGGLNSIRSDNWFSTPGSLFSIVGGSVLQPVFRHGELSAQYRQSEIRRDQAELAFRQILLKAVGEVSDALVQVRKTGEQEQFASRRVAMLRHATRSSHLLFQSGMANYLEVITAESDLLQAELDLADVQRRRLSAVADLYRSVGGGWQE
ncbi:MAG: efflux transporter outer membrane subunit [Chlorobiaceae bacterium]|nr:efflux transporter outer membrane subunit [Chlorobiaceae bacterium]